MRSLHCVWSSFASLRRVAPQLLWTTMLCLWISMLCVGTNVATADEPSIADRVAFFESKVRPILSQHCFECHGGQTSHGGLTLDHPSGIDQGGESGAIIVRGSPHASRLMQAIEYKLDDLKMPPEDHGGKLSNAEIESISDWIRTGANMPDITDRQPIRLSVENAKSWWSFRPISDPPLPRSEMHADLHCNQVDLFVDSMRQANGVVAVPRADRRTLIRRATYDLTGLPPTMQEVEAFCVDSSPDAYSRLIDRLLNSPQYGEHWARHWLDIARYADTAGENTDHPVPDAWRYRNWVIDAFNQDMPYDEFVREQLAGDLIALEGPEERYASRVAATGFLAIARRFDHDTDKHMHLTYEDAIDTLGRAFLGQSIACARCHDHKYDPISAADYYALYGILQSTRFPFPGCEPKPQPRDLVPLMPPNRWAQEIEPWERKRKLVEDEMAQVDSRVKQASQKLSSIPALTANVILRGEIANAGSQRFASSDSNTPIQVHVGDTLLLSISPLTNHGADSTLVEWIVTEEQGEKRRWNLTDHAIQSFAPSRISVPDAIHHPVWSFWDRQEGTSST
jgi:hypothetical protein